MWEWLLDRAETSLVLALMGALIGLAFGYFGQRSKFCLRAATIEFAERQWGQRTAVWLVTFSVAVMSTQLAIELGWFHTANVRALASLGSLSGSILGGLMFGFGMILTRGCSSRLLILAGTGNLRALISGLIFAVTAQAATGGILAPLREWLNALWTIPGGDARDLLAVLGLGRTFAIAFTGLWLAAGVVWAIKSRVPRAQIAHAIGVGLIITAAWVGTFQLSLVSFDPVAIRSITLTTPSANVLMSILATPTVPFDFDFFFIPAVLLGSFLAAWRHNELELQGFQGGQAMRRYIAGAILMGFGGILAGGCAVGAGVTGAAVFSLTAWVTLLSMWIGGMIGHLVVDARSAHAATSASAAPASR